MPHRKVEAVITAITGARVIVTGEALKHVIEEHFRIVPKSILLEMMEMILRDPTDVYQEIQDQKREFNFFYRLDNGEFIVAVVKIIPDGAFLASMYPTGKKPRGKHSRLKKVKL